MNRFDTKYINELLTGNLTVEGYNHILQVVVYFVKYNRWPVNIISPGKQSDSYWTNEDYQEILHHFLEWLFIKGKLKYVHKVPVEYRGYYLLQLLMSFVADKVSEYQKSRGISYALVKTLSLEVLDEKFCRHDFEGKRYWFNTSQPDEGYKNISFEDTIKNLPQVVITEKTKHFKPHIASCISSIFDVYRYFVEEVRLIRSVFQLFDQSQFIQGPPTSVSQPNNIVEASTNFQPIINKLMQGLNPASARLFLEYLFSDNPPSLENLATIHGLPKSTVHAQISSFKKKISNLFIPVNEDVGSEYIQSIHKALDKIANS